MTKQLTWYECSRELSSGDRVQFVEDFDIFPYCIVPKDTLATVIQNNLNELHCGLFVLPDTRLIRKVLAEWDGEVHLGCDLKVLAEWDGEVHLGCDLNPGAYEPETDEEWQALSPLRLVSLE